MNIAFFLTPKKDVIHIRDNATMRQALEKMEYHRYTAVPIIDEEGKYIGTLTEGDLLWKMKHTDDLTFKNTSKIFVKDIPMNMVNNPVKINSDIESLIHLAKCQNFVPVVDDSGVFIGIIKRSDIINYCYDIIYANNQLKKIAQ
ncbi:CBS domain-containing protein [Oceanirhabdus sp. W0125-5]|uniref:CBS domain-containing protein n=1 Tax=Oceanirhabdus sp. W0125-5 TaxID=2999116 RepID=UPI0022F307A8|nr:CBS domain-containing protein [Oceanirhabdus sp. W0125-5]WBW98417.1 CBS domain-containing protein [Oceanirhabdus sp. W0125-5]